ncbi:GNAT family N-acetyltransferase [Draconibacterium sp. IB214405]|uniref:GNAT family N-acetyltransferase n=1 Tax=Draconibacterium sp. IB214405 TaxID=3097352 RepID=UPI002A0BCA02|nr:GNAT family N-acetyltransferase [Draconibacterium sp. IB214405]MDX8341772.1 GNAT family N-acetyltransferase [Draconibacterium sp. IB214405]
MSFLAEKCTFTVLTKEVIDQSADFDCGHSDLNDFFRNDCIDYSNQLLGKTYCFLLDEDPTQIICAFTVANDSIKTNILPNSRKKRVIKKIPHVKHFNSYPAVLIGRLGVNEAYKCQGVGRQLMDFIKSWFIDPFNKTGCRFVVVDSYNEKQPVRYYQKNDFDFIFSTEEQEREALRPKSEEPLTTRLMYFDLIILSADIS